MPAIVQLQKPSREEIARRAYDIWISLGRPAGVEKENWLRAEQELYQEAANKRAIYK